MLTVVAPVFHWKLSAPWAVSVLDPPAHMAAGDATAVTSSDELTVTVTDAVPEHPQVVPVTEYVVVEFGLTVILEVVAPVFHT